MITLNHTYQNSSLLQEWLIEHNFISKNNCIVQVFCDVSKESEMKKVYDLLSVNLPNAQVIGTTTDAKLPSIEQIIISISIFTSTNIEPKKENFQHSKLTQIEDMISMIAHQWKQPLNAISAASINLSLLSSMGKIEAEEVETSSAFIQKQCQEISSAIDVFFNFVKPSKEPRVFLLSSAVKNVMQIMGVQLLNKKIEVSIVVEDKGAAIKGHRDLLEQVIISLLSNSRDAFNELSIKEKFIKITIFLQDNIAPTISVEDNAGARPHEIYENIFNLHRPTQEKGMGIASNLYTSINIMQKSFKGDLTYLPTKDGSCFQATCKETKENE